MARLVVLMATLANDDRRPHQPRQRGLLGIDHDLGRRIVAPGSMTGLALDRGKPLLPRSMAREASLLTSRWRRRHRVGRRRPRLIHASMTELAAFGAYVRRAVSLRARRGGEGNHRRPEERNAHSTETDTLSILSPLAMESTTSC